MKRFYISIVLVGLLFASTTEAQNITPSVFLTTLKRGMRNEDVRNLQITLAQFADIYPDQLVTGYFGALTEAAVKKFQAKYAIAITGTPATTGFGLVGPKTRKALNELYIKLPRARRRGDLFPSQPL